jgi:hypothetical protein
MVINAHNSDTEKDEFEISNTEVVEIIRSQVFDPFASEMKKLLKGNVTPLLQNMRNLFGKGVLGKALNLAEITLASRWLKNS